MPHAQVHKLQLHHFALALRGYDNTAISILSAKQPPVTLWVVLIIMPAEKLITSLPIAQLWPKGRLPHVSEAIPLLPGPRRHGGQSSRSRCPTPWGRLIACVVVTHWLGKPSLHSADSSMTPTP